MAKFVVTIEAMIEAPTAGAAEAQRQALKNALGNPMMKQMALEPLGIKMVGYRVLEEVKPVK